MSFPRVGLGATAVVGCMLGLACSSNVDPPSPSPGGSSGTTTAGTMSGGAAGSGSQDAGGTPPDGGSAGAAAGTPPSAGGSGGAGGQGAGGSAGSAGSAGAAGAPTGGTGGASGAGPNLPDVGTEGDGDYMAGPTYTTQADLTDRGKPKGRSFSFSMPLAKSEIFDGKDSTLDPGKVNTARTISVYVPAKYEDGSAAPVLVIQDGPGELGLVKNALDNLTVSEDENRKLPPFVVIAVQNGGNDAIGSERGLEYDTLSDRYARFIQLEVMPAVVANAQIKEAYPGFKLTEDASGRATLGCSSGGAAAFTMAWFRPDLFARVVAYSTTLVAQQDPKSPESAAYPLGAWEYHSSKQLIAADTMMKEKRLRIFLNVNENDLRSNDAESTHHNWVMANQRTAAALKAKGFHYRFVQGRGAGHCDAGVRNSTLTDALVWVWRGYQAP